MDHGYVLSFMGPLQRARTLSLKYNTAYLLPSFWWRSARRVEKIDPAKVASQIRGNQVPGPRDNHLGIFPIILASFLRALPYSDLSRSRCLRLSSWATVSVRAVLASAAIQAAYASGVLNPRFRAVSAACSPIPPGRFIKQ